MNGIELKNIGKSYDVKSLAVENVNLAIDDKEFIVLVGPSGCGKSTILRMIAGLEDISEGQILIDGQVINDKEPKDRDIAMVFQNYALYPSMNVYDNIAFSLKLAKISKEEIDEKVRLTAQKLQLEDLLDRKPKQLSGGQRQRVALGRALVRNPKAFLLDEPLSNLDAKLRTELRSEIIKLHRDIGTTFIYVTHDQVEAMTMADRIVVLKDGQVQQVDTPKNIYTQPDNKFVAEFIGNPGMNFFEGKIIKDGGYYFDLVDYQISLENFDSDKLAAYLDKTVNLGVRPEDIIVSETGMEAKYIREEMLGSQSFVYLENQANANIIVEIDENDKLNKDSLRINFRESKIHLFDPESEKRI